MARTADFPEVYGLMQAHTKAIAAAGMVPQLTYNLVYGDVIHHVTRCSLTCEKCDQLGLALYELQTYGKSKLEVTKVPQASEAPTPPEA